MKTFLEYLNESRQSKLIQPDGTFDINQLKEINLPSERIKFCQKQVSDKHIASVGFSDSRIVYQIETNKCIKLARNLAGLYQNKDERQLIDQNKDKIFIPKLYLDQSDEYGWWNVMEYGESITDQDLMTNSYTSEYPRACYGISLREFTDAIKWACGEEHKLKDINKWCLDILAQPSIDGNKKYEKLYKFLNDLRDFCKHIYRKDDIKKLTNWKCVNRGGDIGEVLILVDLGIGFSSQSSKLKQIHYNKGVRK